MKFIITGCSSVHRDRSHYGGGILLYISESLTINSTNINGTFVWWPLNSSMALWWLVYSIAHHPTIFLTLWYWDCLGEHSTCLHEKFCPSKRFQYWSTSTWLSLCHWTYQHYLIISSIPSCKFSALGKQTTQSHLSIMCIHWTLDLLTPVPFSLLLILLTTATFKPHICPPFYLRA